MSAPDRRAMLDRADKALSVRRQCALAQLAEVAKGGEICCTRGERSVSGHMYQGHGVDSASCSPQVVEELNRAFEARAADPET